jgi:hypothetical protein
MVVNGTLLLLLRSVSTALLAMVGGLWVLLCVRGEREQNTAAKRKLSVAPPNRPKAEQHTAGKGKLMWRAPSLIKKLRSPAGTS